MSASVRPSSVSWRVSRLGLDVVSLPWRTMANDGPLPLAAAVLRLEETPPLAPAGVFVLNK